MTTHWQNAAVAAGRPVRAAGGGVRRAAWILAGTLAVWLCLATSAQLTASEEVVIVRSSGAGPYQEAADAIRTNLANDQHGVEVLNLSDLSDNDDAGFNKLVADNKTRLFVAIGTQAATWLHQKAPEAIGVVYCMVSDPESAGLLKGRASRGISTTVATQDQFNLIAQALPKARKIGMLYSSRDKTSAAGMTELKGLLKPGYELVAIAVEDCDSTTAAVQKLIDAKPDIIWTSPDSNVFNAATVRSLLLTALRAKVAVFGFSSGFVRAGALLGLGVEPAKQGEQCAELARQFLTALKDNKLTDYLKLDRVVAPRFQLAVNKIVDKQLDKPLAAEVADKAEIVFN